ncbi:MAG: DNA-3-methyladenine glycosylase [Saprospiraceae bacterium]|nr:DNA-3-methyladenine glycosylase [Saprospiraceae bacterium]MBL0100357.1 DNA-3-methyladenine glycosylase [Saprospiraceae bacterium]
MHTTKDFLPESFYLSNDVVQLAKALLGKEILTQIHGQVTSGLIVETEAYRGPDDRGCHAFGGRYTERTKTMYTQGGVAYVYICYGMHPMMNVVTGEEGNPHAVLIRAIQPIEGAEIMAQRRKSASSKYVLTNGPGKLAIALGITKELDGTCLFNTVQPITIYNKIIVPDSDIISGSRVGMSIHVGSCSHRPWRFYIKDNPWVSKPLFVDYSGKW